MKKIIACIDSSSLNKNVCESAINIAKILNLKIYFLNVNEVLQDYATSFAMMGVMDPTHQYHIDYEIIKELNESKDRAAELKNILGLYNKFALNSGLDSQIIQEEGDLVVKIQSLCDNESILVIGNSASSNQISRNLFDIIKYAKSPIFTLSSNIQKVDKILVAYDGSNASDKILDFVCKNFKNAEKIILNLNESKEKSDQILSKTKETYSDENLKFISIHGSIDEMLDFANKNEIDLIACGAFNSNPIKRFFFGSFSAELIEESKLPIVTIS
ncbi:universal stress protein [Campylobacter sp. RM12327]|uniref:universal stress protein n=1 Tax=Campylobacter sputorum TaxID=206 RepID=UPI000B7856AF|nr:MULTISPECIES: universal stress protein [Campylobacter]ASM39426.1 universal stress protein [Campylobacter sputorum]MBE7358240.1 universal stress protein [Campylobacter sp. RM11302]MBF6669532.1 universal stress protein [Campylobacter sp. RM12327]MBF6674241.1 universal stress protein [Campylobacter sp. RM13538]MBF6676025.1 universal stress protein [Campylobacter sp. RM12321]